MRPLPLLLMLFILSTSVTGIGIAPAYREINFEPGQTLELNFRIINNENKNMMVAIYPRSENVQYISLDEKMVSLGLEEIEKTVNYKLSMPKTMPPGDNVISIFVVEIEDNQTMDEVSVVKTKIGVIHKVIVKVPYPRVFLQGLLYISEAKPQEKVTFTVPLVNLGEKDLDAVSAQIIIFDDTGRGIAQTKTNTISIASGEKSKLVGEWMADVEPGTYKAQAVVEYNKEILVLEKNFDIGEPLVDIKEVQIAQFKLGSVAKFDIILESKWNSKIENIRAITKVYDEKTNLISSYDSNPIDLPGLTTKSVSGYWDTAAVEPNEYILAVRIDYLGRTKERNYEIMVSDDKIEFIESAFTGRITGGEQKGSGTITIITGALVLMLISVAILSLRKSKKYIPLFKKPVMKSRKLKDYIRYNMSQGVSIKALKNKLVAEGNDEQEVDRLILEIEDETKAS